MAVLKPHDRLVMYANPVKSTATMAEIKEFVNDGGSGGVDESYVDNAVAPKADKTYVDGELAKKADKSFVDSELTKKADKSSLNKAGVGLGNVDNTSDANKPVSTAQKAALDKKVDLEGIHKTYNATLPQQRLSEVVDLDTLDYGEHTIHTPSAINAPTDTLITLVQVLKTHSAASSVLPFTPVPSSLFQQGAYTGGTMVGRKYSDIIQTESSFDPIRLRTSDVIPLAEFGRVRIESLKGSYLQYVICFDKDKLSTGKVHDWTKNDVIVSEDTAYIAILVRNAVNNETPITPAEVSNFRVSTSPPDPMKGEARLQIAWGATKGDLHTRVGVTNNGVTSYTPWSVIGSQVPSDAQEGSTLEFRGGKWVAVPPVGGTDSGHSGV